MKTTKLPNVFISIDPTFTILEHDEAEEEMKKLIEATKSEEGCIYYGFVKNGDKLICREAYVDGDAVNKHVENVGVALGACLENGILKLESVIVHGPKDQLEIAKQTTESFGALYAETVPGGFTNFTQAAGNELKEHTFCSVVPTFTILNEEKLMNESIPAFIAKTKEEDGCLYYGFTKYGDKMVCREAYKDGEAINKHVESIGDMLTAALEGGILKLDSINIQGPRGETEVSKKTTEAFGTEYIDTVGGFARFTA